MAKLLRPSLPNYIPTSESGQLDWLTNYKVQLPLLGPGYGLSEAAIVAALLAINGLIAVLTMLRDIRAWLSKWVLTNQELQYDKPKDGTVKPNWPELPKWLTLPDPITVNAWQPILETTRILSGLDNLSETDRNALKLKKAVPAKKRPVSAETLDYPLLRISEENGSVVIRTLRGKKYKALMAKFVIDYSNNGVFTDLTTSVDKDVLVPIVFPAGVTIMTWSIQAVYMEKGAEKDKWCPPLSIVLRKEGPVMAPAAEQPAITVEKTGASG